MTNKIELQTKEPVHEEIINYINDQNIFNSDKDKLKKIFTKEYLKDCYKNEIKSHKEYFISNFLKAKSHRFNGQYWKTHHQDQIKCWTDKIKEWSKANNKSFHCFQHKIDYYAKALIEAIEKQAWEEQAIHYLKKLDIKNTHWEGDYFIFESVHGHLSTPCIWLEIQLDKFFNEYDTTDLVKADIDDRVGRMEQATY